MDKDKVILENLGIIGQLASNYYSKVKYLGIEYDDLSHKYNLKPVTVRFHLQATSKLIKDNRKKFEKRMY